MLNRCAEEFASGLRYTHSFRQVTEERWTPPRSGWWKVNYDTAFANGRVAVVVVMRDDFGLIVKAYSKLCMASFAYEAETKVAEWAVCVAAGEDRNNFLVFLQCSSSG